MEDAWWSPTRQVPSGWHPQAVRDDPVAHGREFDDNSRHRIGSGSPHGPGRAARARHRRSCRGRLQDRILAARSALGSRLVILGHHYQRDEVIRHADFTGDSFKLAQLAATRPEAEFIVFCGVHFMAESADILSAPHQKVVLPDLDAGCTMADMAETDQVEDCWDVVTEVVGRTSSPSRT